MPVCVFAMVLGVYFLLSYREEEVHSFAEGKEVHVQQHIHQKNLNLCLPLFYYGKVIVKLGKTQTRNLAVFMVLVI